MKMMELDLDFDHYCYDRNEKGVSDRQLLKSVKVLVGFSNEIKENRNNNIDEIKKRIYLQSKAFMGNKTGREIAAELGMSESSVSRYIKTMKEG